MDPKHARATEAPSPYVALDLTLRFVRRSTLADGRGPGGTGIYDGEPCPSALLGAPDLSALVWPMHVPGPGHSLSVHYYLPVAGVRRDIAVAHC